MVRVVCIEKITGCNISQDRPPLTPVRKTYAGLICRKILRVAGDQHTIFIQGTGPDDRIREFKSMLALPSALAIAVNRRYPPKARRRLTQTPLQRDPIQAFDTNASTTQTPPQRIRLSTPQSLPAKATHPDLSPSLPAPGSVAHIPIFPRSFRRDESNDRRSPVANAAAPPGSRSTTRASSFAPIVAAKNPGYRARKDEHDPA